MFRKIRKIFKLSTLNSKLVRGSAIIVAMGVMTVLLILAAAIAEVTVKSLRVSKNVEQMNQAYFAAEAGIELALYDLTEHDAGYQKAEGGTANDCDNYVSTALNLNGDCEWKIDYYNKGTTAKIPPAGGGSSPGTKTDAKDYDIMMKGDTYNLALYYDSNLTQGRKTVDNDLQNNNITDFKLYLRSSNSWTPSGTAEVITWELSATDSAGVQHILMPTDNAANAKILANEVHNTNPVLTELTQGDTLEKNGDGTPKLQTISFFFSQVNQNIYKKPVLKLSGVGDLGANVPYLEFRITAGGSNISLPTSHASLTSYGYSGGVKQTLTTKVKQGSTVPVFDYTLFQ